jgi:hypothetical protein
MATEPPPQGTVILYPYLWASERSAGETEGRKPRPACLILRVHDPARAIHHLALLAITSQPPRRTQAAIEIPDTERRRGGLTRYPRAWVIVSEYNYDVAEQSWYYEPNTPALGRFSAPFVREVAQALRAGLSRSLARIDRTR